MILTFLAPLNTRRGGSIFPEAVTVMAAVAHFVSFVDLHTWTVLAPTNLQHSFRIECKWNWSLVHIQNKSLVTTLQLKLLTYDLQKVQHFSFCFLRSLLRFMGTKAVYQSLCLHKMSNTKNLCFL